MSKPIEIGDAYPIRDIGLSSIRDSETRMRKMQEAKVAELVTSMKASGLINPITVRPIDGGGYRLVTGEHRLRAARKLRWAAIKCFVRNDLDDDAAALIEIDENLCRADLTADEKREHIRRRKELWEKRQAESASESGKRFPTLTGRGNLGFAADTAAQTGMTKRRINQLLAEPKPKPVERQAAPARTPEITSWDRLVQAWEGTTLDEKSRFGFMVRDAMDDVTVTIARGIEAARSHYSLHVMAITDGEERKAEYHKLKFSLADADIGARDPVANATAKQLLANMKGS